MYYKLDEASLIVDPKGFPFREMQLPKDSLYKAESSADSKAIYKRIKGVLLNNWVFYEPENLVEFDFSLCELSALLGSTIKLYTQTIRERSSTSDLKQILQALEAQLQQYLGVLLEVVKRTLFYEISLRFNTMFQQEYSITSLFFYTDNFRIMRLVSEVELRLASHLPLMMVEDHRQLRKELARALIGSRQFVGTWRSLFSKQPGGTATEIVLTDGSKIDLSILAKEEGTVYQAINDHSQINQIDLGSYDRTRLSLYCRILKNKGDVVQMGNFLQFSKNMYLTKQEHLQNEHEYWQSIYEETIYLLAHWEHPSLSPTIQLNQIVSHAHSDPHFPKLMQSLKKLQNEQFLINCNFYYKNTLDEGSREVLDKLMMERIKKIIQESVVIKNSEDVFEYIESSGKQPPQELLQSYLRAMKLVLDKQCDSIDVYEFECSFMQFFKYYLSSERSQYFPHIFTAEFLRHLRIVQCKDLSPKTRRLTHFLFNQMVYFCLMIPEFQEHLSDLLVDPEVFKIFVLIYKRFLQHNQIVFKSNFKLLHKIVSGVYRRGEETFLKFIEVIQLYWEIAAKFLLFWGGRSYLQEDTDALKEHYDMLLVKVMDLLPHLSRTHEKEQNTLCKFITQEKDLYNKNYMRCWLNVLAFKHKTFSEHILHICVFIKQDMPQNHFKNMVKLAIQFQTPITALVLPKEDSGFCNFTEDVEQLTSDFAVEVLEITHSFLTKWLDMDYQWVKEMPELFWQQYWAEDRELLLSKLLNTNKAFTADRWVCLDRLRKMEIVLMLYNQVVEKLTEETKKDLKLVMEIQQMGTATLQSIWRGFANTLSKECVEYFHSLYVKLRQTNKELTLHYEKKQEEAEGVLCLGSSSSKNFEKTHIYRRFTLINLCKQFFDSMEKSNPQNFTMVVEARIAAPIAVDYTGKPPIYKIFGRTVELIRTIEGFFCCSSDLEKSIKCKNLIPLSINTLTILANRFTELDALIKLLSTRESFLVKVSELLIRQIRKYFTAFLLHELLTLNNHLDEDSFQKLLASHMQIHKAMLSYMTTVFGFYEQTHSIYLQVLEASIKTLPTAKPSELPKRKSFLTHFILSLFNLYLYSTFTLRTRVRSALFSQLISRFQDLTGKSKKTFNKAILFYLRRNFNKFTCFELTNQMQKMVEGDVKEILLFDDTQQIKDYKEAIVVICTQAMIINLLARNNFNALGAGIRSIFGNKEGSLAYLRYLEKVSTLLLQVSELEESDLETIILDVFGCLESIYQIQFDTSLEETIRLLGEVTKRSLKIKLEIREVRQNLIKLFLSFLFQRPQPKYMEPLRQIDNNNYLLASISYESSIANQCRSHLHLLNVLYLDKGTTNSLRDNWKIIVQNYPPHQIQQTALTYMTLEDNSPFLLDYSCNSSQLASLLSKFTSEFSPLQPTTQYYHYYKVILALAIKFPSLIPQILDHQVQSSKFMDWMFETILPYSYRMMAEFVVLLAKTNSGFQVENGLLVSHNLVRLMEMQERLKSKIEGSKDLLTIINSCKILELLISKGHSILFSIYKFASLPANFLVCYTNTTQAFQSSLLKVLLESIKTAPSPVLEFLFTLLDEVLSAKLKSLGSAAQENLLYYNNQELFNAIFEERQVKDKEFIWLEIQKLSLKQSPKQDASQGQREKGEGFLWNHYSLLSEEEDSRIKKQSQSICQKMQQLSEANIVSKNISKICRNIHTESANGETYTLLQRRVSVPDFMRSQKPQKPSILCQGYSCFDQLDSIQQPDMIAEPDCIQQPPLQQSNSKPGTIHISSFQNLATQPNSDSPIARPPLPRCSFQLIQSQNSNSVIVSRVQKMQLMNDLENGVNVKPKLQFLSNDELDKMIAVSDGELLFHLQREKEARTGNNSSLFGNGVDEEEGKRYLDQVYPGCRVNDAIKKANTEGQTMLPDLTEDGCVRLVNALLGAEGPTIDKLSKLIEKVCLNNSNLIKLAPLLTYILALRDPEAKYIQRNQQQFRFPHLKSLYTDYSSLVRIKSNISRLISTLIDNFVGLPIWLFGTFDPSTCSFSSLPFKMEITLPQKPSLGPSRLVDIVLWNFVQPNQDTTFVCLAESLRKYIEICERKGLGEYPYYRIQQSEQFCQENVQTLANSLVSLKKRVKSGTPFNSILKVLLQVYPTCYEVFMMEFLKVLSDEFRTFVEQSTNQFKRFRLNYSLKPETCIEISKDPDRLERLIDSYLFFVREKNQAYEQTAGYLRKVLTDVCFDVVPWFRSWRFLVEQREDNRVHKEESKQMLQKIKIYRQQRLYEDIEKAELELLKHQITFANFRNKKINQFSCQYLKPIHEALSVGLLHSLVKGQQLVEMMLTCFVPAADRIQQLALVYKRVSNIWKSALAFSNLFIDEDCSQYHTMSNLQTHQILKSKNDIPLKSSSNGVRGSERRKSAKLSITTVNPFNIEKIVNKFLKISPLIASFTKEGCRLGRVLAKYGGLDLKLKTLRRKKTGVVKEIDIDRERVWFDTMLAIDNDFVTKDIRIKFKDEMGVDYGGLTKQWLTLITKQLFNPNFGLFELSANKLNIQPSKCSHVVPNHLGHFRKLGVLVGKALIDDWQLQINFTKSFLKHLLGATLYVQDLDDIDPETTRSLLWILENQIDESLQITFSHEMEVLGERKVVPLIENGDNIYVNQSNKRDYVKAVCKAKMTDLIRNQSKAFMQGLESVIPYSTLKHINYRQLGLYLAGMPTINLSQMKQYAQYNNYQRGDRVIEWFWAILNEFDKQTLANFLFFLTGSFKVPYGGFKEYPITVNKSYCKEHLPIAHTCFNTIDLPDYPDKKTLATKLKLSISEGKGFNVS